MLKALGNKVVLVKDQEDDMTATGLHIPNVAKEKKVSGKVTSVGEKVEGLTVGDTIVMGKYAGDPYTEHGIEYTIINDEEILCKVVKDEN